jgi:uncharacterized CHY-type Zn-finger protein
MSDQPESPATANNETLSPVSDRTSGDGFVYCPRCRALLLPSQHGTTRTCRFCHEDFTLEEILSAQEHR